MADTKVLVASDGQIAQVQIIGRGTFVCSQSLREFGNRSVDLGVVKLIIDLSQCQSMDSTFMGVLAMLAQQSKDARVEIVNADDYKKKLLSGLGISRLFTFARTDTDEIDWQALCHTTPENPISQGKTMLDAHEALIEADPENAPIFKDVVEFLRQDIEDQENGQ